MSSVSAKRNEQASARLRPAQRPAIFWAIADAWVLAKRRLVQIPRIPDELIFATIQPIMFVVLFRYVFGGAIKGIADYPSYVMAGIFVQTVIFGATTTGVGLAQDLEKGLIDRFRSLPMAKSAVLTGRTIADLLRNVVVVLVMVVVGLLVGFHPSGNPLKWLLALALLLAISFAFSWISATVGLISRTVEVAQSAGFIWLFPLTFASTSFTVTAYMPTWLQGFAQHQPVSIFNDTIRALTLNTPLGNNLWISLAWIVGILVVFIPLSVWTYGRRVGR